MKYITKEGDMLDAICHGYYDGRPETVEAVLNANPGLAKLKSKIPEGTVIELIELEPVKKATISLWD